MTINHGMLLFDSPETAINGWENQLGYRGYIEVWRKGAQEIIIEVDEDHEPSDFNDVKWWAKRYRMGKF